MVTSQSLLDPAPDHFHLDLDSVFLSNSSLHAKLDAFEADLCLEDSDIPFAQLSIPPIDAANGTHESVSQEVQIKNKDQFYAYAQTQLLSEEYNVYLKGKGGLKYGKLQKTTVKYNDKITLKGRLFSPRPFLCLPLLTDVISRSQWSQRFQRNGL